MKRITVALLFVLFVSLGAAFAPLPTVGIAGVSVTGTEESCAGYWVKVGTRCSSYSPNLYCPYPYGMLYTKYRWYAGSAMTGYYPTNTYKEVATGCLCYML